MIQYDSNLLPLYVEQCDRQQLDATICMIGHLAKDIGAGHTNFSPEYLKTIISKFPRSYLYYLLGESYLAIDQRADAQKSFISAISLTNNPTIRATITAKITTLL